MTEDELRALVRESVARHLGSPPVPSPGTGVPRADPAHARFRVFTGQDADGPCLIEPAVPCVHCGYCQSYGH